MPRSLSHATSESMNRRSARASAVFAVAAAATASFPPCAAAQPTVRPASSVEAVEPRLVTPRWLGQEPPRLATGDFTTRFFRVVEAGSTQTGVHRETLRRLQGPRDTLFLRVRERKTPDGLRSDTLVFRASDLVPEPQLLEGFDEANLDLVCIALAQRGEGDYLVPTVSRPSGEEVTYRVRVAGMEQIRTARGPVAAIRVVYAHPSGQNATLWVDAGRGTVVLEGALMGDGTRLYAVTEAVARYPDSTSR